MARYPVIATLFFLVITIYSLWTGSSPQLGFWGHIWHFAFGSLFTSLGLMGGELFRRFTQPNMLFADGAQEMFKKKLFWKVGPQLIGGVVGYIAAGGFLQNVLGYYVG
ncbi:hypothetical protein ACUZ8Y_15795 [Aeromonas veronii]|uniref:hypothetical protein n=1 Tax=Aeromonas veronii TaxID=654 RepID=UPI00406BBAEC